MKVFKVTTAQAYENGNKLINLTKTDRLQLQTANNSLLSVLSDFKGNFDLNLLTTFYDGIKAEDITVKPSKSGKYLVYSLPNGMSSIRKIDKPLNPELPIFASLTYISEYEGIYTCGEKLVLFNQEPVK